MRNGKIILLLSGEICSGKSKLCENLRKKFDFDILKTKVALKQIAIERSIKISSDRSSYQKVAEKFDNETNGDWVRNFFQKDILNSSRAVIDAVRILSQIDAFRQSYGQSVIHIHLQASPKELEKRFLHRNDLQDSNENVSKLYAKYKADKTEKQINSLEKNADLVIDTERNRPEDVLVRVCSFLKILPQINNKLVDVLIGGQFGSEGKGQVAAYLAPNYDCLVRVGGPNAGHKVYAEPEPHVFHIIPSGAVRNEKAKLIIGPGAVISLKGLFEEIERFKITDPERLLIDSNATIISEADITYEKKHSKIGSTVQGVGKATSENILNRLKGIDKFKAKNCKALRQFTGSVGSAHEQYENIFSGNKRILLEGTQGTFLSIFHGLYPHVTSRDTTASGCLAEAGIAVNRVNKIIMVTRTYPIRVQNPEHGTSGDFNSEELTYEELSKRSSVPLEELLKTELTSTTRKQRRIAEFSWSLFRKACELNSPTDIAMTFVDYIDVRNQKARRYDQLTDKTTNFIEDIERCAGAPVSLIATRFSYRAIIDRRNWI